MTASATPLDPEALADLVIETIDTAQKPIAARVASLEARLTALEQKPHVKFCGTFERGRTYEPGDAATHQGGLWICKAATPGAPGEDFVGWQLAVKRGHAS